MKFIVARFSRHRKLYQSINNLFGFYPNNIHLYELAFRHKSVSREIKDGLKNSNDRLEFLGDAVLSAAVAHYLFAVFPYKDEGFLTEIRSRIVRRSHLNKLALKIGIDKLLLSNIEKKNSNSISGNTFEALIGAIYLDKGFDFTQKIIIDRIFKHHIDLSEIQDSDSNFKSKIINWAQKNKKSIEFKSFEIEGEGMNNKYLVKLFVQGEFLGEGLAHSKKNAEQVASEKACLKLLVN